MRAGRRVVNVWGGFEVGVVDVELASNQDVAPSGAQIVPAAQARRIWQGSSFHPKPRTGRAIGSEAAMKAYLETWILHYHNGLP